jgi:hypothetical protein
LLGLEHVGGVGSTNMFKPDDGRCSASARRRA